MRTKNPSTRRQSTARLLLLGCICLAAWAPQASAELIIERTITANQIVPDNYQINSSIALTGFSSISNTSVDISLSSPYASNPMYLGDMKATLTLGQTGETGIRSAVLFDYKTTEPTNNATSLSATYAPPATFYGPTPASNRWILTVADQTQGGVARLDSWKLTVTGTSATAGTILDPGTNGAIRVNSDNLTNVASKVSLAGTVTTTVGAANQILSFDGGLTGSGNLKKDGAGILAISAAADNFTGATTVTAGELRVTNTSGSATGTGAVTVNGSGTLLTGTGRIDGSVTMANETILSAGANGEAGSVGTLTVGALTLNDTTAIKFDLGTTSDLVAVNGALTLDGKLTIAQGLGFGAGRYTLFTYTGGLGNLQNNNLDILSTSSDFTYSINTSTANSVFLDVSTSAVPEPATWVGAGLITGLAVWSQRKRLMGKSRN